MVLHDAAADGGARVRLVPHEEAVELDVRDRLADIRSRTLIISRGSDPWRVEGSRYMADRIPGSTGVRLPGEDVYPWAGNWEPVTDEVQRFLTGSLAPPEHDINIATLLFTDIVASTALAAELGDAEWHARLQRHHEILRALLRRYHGMEVDTAGDGFFATFASPGRAVRCATDMTAAVSELGLEIRAGLHTGEVEKSTTSSRDRRKHRRPSGRLAGPSDVLVRDLSESFPPAPASRSRTPARTSRKAFPDRWHLYRVVA